MKMNEVKNLSHGVKEKSMAVSARVTNGANAVLIFVADRFDIYLHRGFRDCYRNEKPNAAYTIDLSKAIYMDSSALGMLLLLREFAGDDRANITISGYTEKMKRIFSITNFNRLFTFT